MPPLRHMLSTLSLSSHQRSPPSLHLAAAQVHFKPVRSDAYDWAAPASAPVPAGVRDKDGTLRLSPVTNEDFVA